MARSFRHLKQSEIREIVAAAHRGETQTSIARRFEIDRSTVHYHLQQYERAFPEQQSAYAVIKIEVRKTCLHPSARCTVCQIMWDKIRREETETIRVLRAKLEDANSRLRVAGLAVESVV